MRREWEMRATRHSRIRTISIELTTFSTKASIAARNRRSRRNHCVSSPVARLPSPTGRTWRPRSTSAVFGSSKPPTWTRRWPGAQSRCRLSGAGRGASLPADPAGQIRVLLRQRHRRELWVWSKCERDLGKTADHQPDVVYTPCRIELPVIPWLIFSASNRCNQDQKIQPSKNPLAGDLYNLAC
jgi:hypothetical protein